MTAPTVAYDAVVVGAIAALLAAETPAEVPGWQPQPKQLAAQAFADDPAVFEILYGGAAGGGKSYWLRNDAVRFCLNHAGAHVGIVRRTMPMLKQTHLVPLRDICAQIAGVVHNRTESTWTFGNGSVLRLISLPHDGDEQNYKSVEFDRLYFDECTELTESQYTYMLSRLRSQRGHPVTSIAVSNPEGRGYAWVKRRFVKPRPGDLVDGQNPPVPMKPWNPPLPGGDGFGRARVYIPATVLDNPALLAANPDYVTQLRSIPDARKRRALLDGDWDAMDQVPGALFSLAIIDAQRVTTMPDLPRVAVAIDPAATSSDTADDTGIIVAGMKPGPKPEFYVLADRSVHLDPDGWARSALGAYTKFEADVIVVEDNQGGEMTTTTLKHVAREMIREGTLPHMPRFARVHATRGKALRADPIAALYATGQVHHVGEMPELETQLTTWVPDTGQASPDRLDALVWAVTYLAKPRAAAVPLREAW